MAWDFEREVGRKIIHLSSVFFIVIYFFFAYFFNHKMGLFALCVLLVVLLEFEYVRIELKERIPLVSYFWKYRRGKERYTLGGDIFFLMGSIIALAVFDLRIAIAAIFMTTFGDMAASLVGRFGKVRFYKKKKWEGVIAQFLVDLLIAFIVIRTEWVAAGEVLWLPVIVMSLVATAVETYVSKIDDNLLIPVIAGLAGQLCLWLL